MEESKSLDHHDEPPNKKITQENIDLENKEQILSTSNKIKINNDLNPNLLENIDDKNSNNALEDNKINNLTVNTKAVVDETKKSSEKGNSDLLKENTPKDNNLNIGETKASNIIDNTPIDEGNNEIVKEKLIKDSKKIDLNIKSNAAINKTKGNPNEIPTSTAVKAKAKPVKEIPTSTAVKAKAKPIKEIPIEKKPFLEFVNDHLIPEIKNQFKLRGKEVKNINLQKTQRPIAEDLCWVIYCEIYDTCNFWLSFEKDDITSLKSFSLCKNYEKPSIIESFLIDEKKITLKLIISRILQRLNGQKLIGAN